MITTASREQTADIIHNATNFGFGIDDRLQPRRRHCKSPEPEQATIDAIQTCLKCGNLPSCREATAVTGENLEPGNFTCYAVSEGFPLVLVRQ